MNAILRIAAGVVVAGVVGMAGATTQAQTKPEETLTVHHFLSPKAPAHAQFIEPWARRVEVQSKGRIKIEIFPSMSMGGKPPELYRQLRDGAADIVWTLIGYTPGVFPRAEVFELPTVHQGSAKATSMAIQDSFDLIAEDFKDIKPILVHAHAGNAMHLVSKAVRTPADLKGLKLRTPSRTGAWAISAWGAEPVGMPLPALPQALSKGVVDGALIPFEVVPPFKLQQLTKYSVEGADGSRFGTSVFLFGMNKQRYDSLPADLKKIIDDNSGANIAADIGAVWDRAEAPGKGLQKKSGGEIIKLDAAAKGAFDEMSQAVVARWIEEANAKNIDGTALVKTARAAVAKNSQ